MSQPRAIISPSVLASDFGKLSSEVQRMMDNGAEWVHMDVMDGHFVPNITMGPPVLASVYKTVPNVFMDCHMMVAEPAKWVKDIAEAGGKSYTFHIEALKDPESAPELVDLIKEHGMRAAVAISPDTPASAISDALGNKVEMILVMTVVPGKGGQKFMPSCVPKVAELRARFPAVDIEVDGGVGPNTVGCCAGAGSNVLVAGTALFGAKDPAAVMKGMKEAVENGRADWGTTKAIEEAQRVADAK